MTDATIFSIRNERQSQAIMTLALNQNEKEKAGQIANEVLVHCRRDSEDPWLFPTQGEANIYLGNTDDALANYGEALKQTWDSRDRDSIQKRAIWAARLMGNEDVQAKIDALSTELGGERLWLSRMSVLW